MLSWLMFITPILWPTGATAENANEELSRSQVQEAFCALTQTIIILYKHNGQGIKPSQTRLQRHIFSSVIFPPSRSIIDFSRPVYSLLSILHHDSLFKKKNWDVNIFSIFERVRCKYLMPRFRNSYICAWFICWCCQYIFLILYIHVLIILPHSFLSKFL